jgi:hypothetical protein
MLKKDLDEVRANEDMRLHEVNDLECHGRTTEHKEMDMVRVPGGWIYYRYGQGTFVPLVERKLLPRT